MSRAELLSSSVGKWCTGQGGRGARHRRTQERQLAVGRDSTPMPGEDGPEDRKLSVHITLSALTEPNA